jgi:predicted dehydrogenase
MSISRRDFLAASAASAVAANLAGARRVLAADNKNSDTKDIRVAVIGTRGQGFGHIRTLKDNLVALCDVDEKILNERANWVADETGRKVEKFVDYRKLVERDDIDAVSIATPNHLHAIITIAAAQAGKDVYVEKPASHNVWEGRQMVNAARVYSRIIQCGTQSRSSESLQKAVAFVQGGKLGKIKYAIGTCYKPRKSIGKLDKPLAIPSHIDYDLWCGPAEKRDLYRPELHYDWHWDFNTGNGDMGNQGIHQMDIARWFLGERGLAPRVLSIGGRLGYEDAGDTPNTQIVYQDYPAAPLVFETRGLPRSKSAQETWGDSMDNYRGSRVGVIVQCENGHVLVPSYSEAIAYDLDGNVVERWQGSGGHHDNWLAAIVSRNPADLNAEILDGHVSSSLCHTGAISHQVGKAAKAGEIAEKIAACSLLSASFDRMASHLRANGVDIDGEAALTLGEWLDVDPETEQIKGNDAASRHLTRDYRQPFVVPNLA